MISVSMTVSGKDAVVNALEALAAALKMELPTDFTTHANHHVERLRQAIAQSHAEGIRFAAFTLSRLADKAGGTVREETREALARLKAAIAASELPH